MIKRLLIGIVLCFIVTSIVSCKPVEEGPVVIKTFSLDTLTDLLIKDNVEIDKNISSDGNGSLRIKADKPTKLNLFEIKDLDVDNVNLLYRAQVRTQDLKGEVYLEMWCTVNGKGPYFSRSLVPPNREEKSMATGRNTISVRKNQKPELVRLSISIEGTGIVWIDTVELIKVPI